MPDIVTNGALLETSISASVSKSQQAVDVTNEIQKITLPSEATGGTFTVSYSKPSTGSTNTPYETTVAIPYNATASEVADALLDLDLVSGPNDIRVTGEQGGPFEVEFTGEVRGLDIQPLLVDCTNITGGVTSSANLTQVGRNEKIRIDFNDLIDGNFWFDVQVASDSPVETTAHINMHDNAATIRSAFEALPSVGVGNVEVTVNNNGTAPESWGSRVHRRPRIS